MKKLILLALAAHVCDSLKILLVFPLPGVSHTILGDGFVKHLLNAGHEVTYITPFPKEVQLKNLTQIDVSENLNGLPHNLLNVKSIMDKKVDFTDDSVMFLFFTQIAVMTVENANVRRLLEDPGQHFDVVIAEWMFSDLYAGFAPVFNCPLIWSSSMDHHWMVLRLMDERSNPAYTADIQSPDMPPFTFTQRVQSLWTQVQKTFKRATIYVKMEQNSYDTHIAPAIARKGRPVPTFEEVKFNASLMFVNSHVSLGQAQSLPQSVISIGGYHIDDKEPPLSDLHKTMDEAKHGLIYFSMGSNLRGSLMPEELKQGLLKIFGELKQTVLWKIEIDLPDRPKNVHILRWAPQQSILSHPNCILFITHGGYLSTTETVHFGVPIIGIPVFADQFINVQRAVVKGFAQRVDLAYDMVDKLKAAIDEAISNPRYKEKVKELSQIYHDRLVPPNKELVHWVEHVVRTRGAPHLRSPALMLPWYQKMYLDLLALIVLSIILLGIILKRLVSNKTSIKQKMK